jgi:long-chain acyl-CoA synthetase
LIGGGRIGYYSGDPLKILDDLQVLKPTIFPSVPRLFNRIYDRIIAGVKEQSASKQWLFNKAVSSKTYYHARDASYNHKFYDTVVFAKMRNLLGGNVTLMCTGSAPINGDVLNYLKVVFGCPIIEGYGATESSAPISATWKNDPLAGHVGGVLPCLKLRLKDIPEMEYFSTDETPRGEVCVWGANVFKGYFKNDEKTKEAIDEQGWLRTGDVGLIYPNGSLKIIDRAKNIFKLSQGEYIAPEKLENVYIQCPLIQQVYVYGCSLQSYLISIATAEPAQVKKWATEKGNIKSLTYL